MKAISLLCLLLAGCAPPALRYLELGGERRFWTGSTPSGDFPRHLARAREAGERLARITLRWQLGQSEEDWLREGEAVLEEASRQGIAVIPILAAWAAWNDGSEGSRWHNWENNPLNAANGGPAGHPSDLYLDGSACQRLFLERLGRSVRRFSSQDGVLAWEVFSELDLVLGADALPRERVVAFVEKAAAVVRENDPGCRPVTASLSGVHSWPGLWSSPGIDLVQIHPYPAARGKRDLFETLAREVPKLRAFGKPVLIGEEGLEHGPPPETGEFRPRTEVGYRQALWAALMTGCANGGMFWWINGYDREHAGLFPGICTPTQRFADRLDFRGLEPTAVAFPEGVTCLALVSPRVAAGYLRDDGCVWPDWPGRRLRGLSITLRVPWEGEGKACFYRPKDLAEWGRTSVRAEGGQLEIPLPDFEEDLAFRIDFPG